ncbi:hypothetical protein E4T42_01145 [Aureobasidium subglaciale]|uniref:Arrestin-like N-terminal domain-containing protein n=1 Tax=Aureobasidium subglaciale (strain EXF-2481) TaxID=1043005 RepID=A0A074YRF5_AURSE|nr:uncharacterized protein AUEXF2481DRAFT_34540 [Aureobasidium subglaciale EXF-2481]KAI5212159.1 hypothetical protein E4T38_00639 [Aureobasidium subglaciale]KAI5231174.1 hypothetical protein E4T40_00640 [Aureobasidium subglaciale]KAI5234188.1 hypothetical protein E4T41_00638 [Aureobasidium subglaciale]KAI5257075.1 hypothetical protein E4T42_01145 [Aureobasidium subglaciale]KAI5267520.1 hypothetical protein E4T46_00638 [Aureobasidium subglaciale]
MSNTLAQDHLRIFLDGETGHASEQSTQHYRPGQTIRGVASYSPSTEVKVEAMIIIFKATLYIELAESGQASYGCIRSHNQNLFRYETLLLKGPHKVSPKPHEWPFEFELPEKVKLPFVADMQPVPPTWRVLQVARVVYSLKLCVNPNRSTRTMEIERGINVWPYDHMELPTPAPETQQLLDPTQKPSWLTRRRSSTISLTQLTRRRSSTVGNTTTPQNFNLNVSMPVSLGAWQRFNIQLVCNGTSDLPFVLQTCELVLKAQISSTNVSTSALPICKLKLLGRGLEIPTDGSYITVKRNMMLVDMTRGDATMLVPNFSIGFFKLAYVLDVCVQLLDAKTQEVLERRAELPFMVLPGGLEEEGSDEDAPPGFHDVVSPPGYEEESVWGNEFRTPAYTVTA